MANKVPPERHPISEQRSLLCTRPWLAFFTDLATGSLGPVGPTGPTGASGPTGPAGLGVPYFIASGDTFTVAFPIQALFSMTIDNEGTIDVDGYLIQVD